MGCIPELCPKGMSHLTLKGTLAEQYFRKVGKVSLHARLAACTRKSSGAGALSRRATKS